MNKRKVGIAAVVVLLLAAVVAWKLHGGGSVDGKAAEAASNRGAAGVSSFSIDKRVDPRKLERASIAGTIRDEDGHPIASARVCADISTAKLSNELVRDPRCAVSGADGAYTIGDLYAAEYRVAALAKPFRPEIYHPDGNRDVSLFELKAGEHRTGVDLVLRKGGVEITGIVADISGGPIAHAQVRASAGNWWSGESYPAIDTDEAGKFSMYVAPGEVRVSAIADGYAPGSDGARAPGKVEILLTPESSLAGTVVDAKTGQPVAGVPVAVSSGDFSWENGESGDITDDHGHFRVTRLSPGRYVSVARAPKGYGHSEGSTLVGLGQHVDGVVVKLYPAYQITGKVVVPGDQKTTCKQSELYLHRPSPDEWLGAIREPDGSLHVDGVLPGKYEVQAGCDGYNSKDKYDALVVVDKDLTGLEWEVEAGSLLRGRVVTKAGTPVEGAQIWASSVGGAARDKQHWSSDTSQKDGTYRLKGLAQGTFKLELHTEKGVGPKEGWKVEVKAPVVDQDLVLDDVGTIKGTVVDPEGKPLAGVHVDARAMEGMMMRFWGMTTVRSSDDGTFTIDGNRAGDYRVVAFREWSDELRKPGTNDDAKQGERVTVHAGQTTTVRLVVEAQSGVIKGTCVDSDGKPVTDAFVSAARESDAAGNQRSSVSETRWSWDSKPTLVSTDGSFAIQKLSPGTYTVRAYRKGGGEAVAEHIAAGSTAKLEFKPTGSIDGNVHRDGGTPEELDIDVRDDKTDFSRHEHFFRTGGHFLVKDLPAGHFTITASTEGGKKQTTVDLSDGQEASGIDIELDPLISITGRVVELGTNKPVAGLQMMVAMGKSGNGNMSWQEDDTRENISDSSGRFTIKNAPRGVVTITGFPKDWSESDYGWVRTVKQADGTGTVDIGDVGVLKRRLKPTDTAGELGVHWVDQPDDTPLDQERFEVSWIDPNGPAGKTELKVGDVVTSVDGIDVTGANHGLGWVEMRAMPGTKLVLGLARGASVTVVLAPPS